MGKPGPKPTDPMARIMKNSYVDLQSPLVNGVHCRMCTLSSFKMGYPKVKVKGMSQGAHRVVYQACSNIALSSAVCVLHLCDRRLCVEGKHLREGSKADISRDMVNKQRQAYGEKNSSAKLTAADVVFIRESDESQKSLSVLFGVSDATINKIKRGKSWRYLLMPIADRGGVERGSK